MMLISINDIAISNIRRIKYCCIINRISKSEAVNVLSNADLTEKRGVIQK